MGLRSLGEHLGTQGPSVFLDLRFPQKRNHSSLGEVQLHLETDPTRSWVSPPSLHKLLQAPVSDLPLQEGRGKSHVALFSELAWQVSTA